MMRDLRCILSSTIVLLAIFGFLMADEQERFFMKVGTAPPMSDIISSHNVHSEVECIFNCLDEEGCVGFKYKWITHSESENCHLSKSTGKNNAAYYTDQGSQFFIDVRNISDYEENDQRLEPHAVSTAAPSLSSQHEQCSAYTWLNETRRNENSVTGNNVNCDNGLSGWYRFGGGAGTKIATSCGLTYRCGTHATGWMNGAHPTVTDGKVIRTVCYHWNNNCCTWSNDIEVINCGKYYVYKLMSTPPDHPCNLAYCGSDN